MKLIRENFRQWWKPPREIRDRAPTRTITFLELFYDLAYVLIIAQLTAALGRDVNPTAIANFAFLFVIVWWAWLNGTIYHDLHGNDDIRTRVFTFAQMLCVAGMAVFAGDALGDDSAGFAIAYGTYLLILTYLWWRTGVYDWRHRPLSRPYVVVFLVIMTAFYASAWVNTPHRFYIWGVVTVVSVLLPFASQQIQHSDPDVQEQRRMSFKATGSTVERYGLFTIIVVGEVIVGVVNGVNSHDDTTITLLLVGALGMLIAIGLWWLYFDTVSARLPQENALAFTTWLYAHLPVAAGIAMTGTALTATLANYPAAPSNDVRWLLVGAVALVLFAITILIETVQTPDQMQSALRAEQIAMSLSAILLLMLGLAEIAIIPFMVSVVILVLSPVVFAFFTMLKSLAQEN